MGRKSTKKKQARAKNLTRAVQAKPVVPPIDKKSMEGISSKQAWLMSALFFVLAILLYSNTFQHRFVLDDHGIIDNNKMTKAAVSIENTKLIFNTPMRRGDVSDKENSLYRPFTKLIFNIQWNAFAGNPHHFHKINVLFYGFLCMIIFWVLYDLFNKKWVLPFLITLLFTVHPIHTEVVANIKSLDEMLAMLGMVAAMRGIQLYIRQENLLHLAWGALAFALGLFSKESTVVAMGIFPLLVYFQQKKIDFKKLAVICAPFLILAILFVYTRSSVLEQFPQNAETSIMDNLIVMVKDDIPARFATSVMIVGFYIYTFFVPHPLACDYSYATLEPVGLGHWGFLLSFLLCLGGFVYALYLLTKRKRISFGILWFFITFSLASNVFFLIGTSFGERLFFTPSLGLSIVTVCLLANFFQKRDGENLLGSIKSSPVLWGIVLLISSLYSIKTVARNVDWQSDYNLFSRDIEYNPNATHLLFYMGNHLPSNDRKEVLTYELSELGYSPQQINDSSNREVALSIQYFRRSLNIYPYLPSDGYNQLGKAYFLQGQLDSALKYYTKAYSEDSTSGIYTNNMGTVYFNSRRYDQAMPYFKKAHSLDDSKADYMNNIGCIYGESNVADSAIYWFKKASAADSLDMKSLQFLEITYRALGDISQADYYRSRMQYVQQLRRDRM